MDKVSIIIPFYNCAYVDEAIESALNQTYKNIEVIVVNDGSTMYEPKIKPYLRKIKNIKKVNGGTASALNTGIKAATGKYFSWLSADDIYEPNKVERQINFMKQEGASVSYTAFIQINSSGKPISGTVGVSFPNKSLFYRKMKRGCPINGCTVMMDTKVFQEVGLFDESLPFTQDYDLWLRVLQKHDFHYLHEPLIRYRVHEEMGTKKNAKAIQQEIQQVKSRYRRALNELILKEVRP